MLLVRRVILVAILAASLLAAVIALRSWHERLLADDLRRQMYTATDAELAGVLAKTTTLENHGLPLVAEALGSFRPSLAFAAHDYLTEHIARVEALAPSERPQHLSKLATALADRVRDFGPTARHWSADMADDILRLAPRDATEDREKLLASCETLVRAAAETSGEPTLVRRGAKSKAIAENTRQPPVDEARAAKFDADWVAKQLLRNDALLDGGLPLPSVDVPALPTEPQPPIANSAEPAAEDGRRPKRFEQPDDAEPLDDGPERLRRDPAAAPVRSQPQLNAPLQVGAETLEPPVGSANTTPTELANIETREILRLWHNSDGIEDERLENELRQRGFTNRDMRLAEKFTDNDPAVRRKLAELLPRISRVRSARWLWWLAEDEDASVRIAAISMLATSNDPTVRSRLRELADRESNSRVAGHLRKILEQRLR